MREGAEILEDATVPARMPWSRRLAAGETLRVIDLEGRQAVDFLCFNAKDPADRYHAPNTMKTRGEIYVSTGSVLYSQRATPLMTMTADTVGKHDTIFGCCSFELDRVRYGRTNARSCQQNFEEECARHGIAPDLLVPNLNIFMYVPVKPDGRAAIEEGLSRPGDYVDLRAETDVIAVLSNCPQELNPASGENGPTPIRVVVWR